MQIFDKKIKLFLKQKMYFHRKVNSKTNFGRKVITQLFTKIKRNPKQYINIKKYTNLNTERIICDYIAGMTDRFALDENIDSIILSIDSKSRTLNLSIKELEIRDEKEALSKYGSSASGASLGDILGSVLKK